MYTDKLDALQRRALEVLADLEPRWTLVGGAALAGFHLGHRPTRDLDLFFHGLAELGGLPERAASALRAHGFTVTRIESAPAFVRLGISLAAERGVLDLVADPAPALEGPELHAAGSAQVGVATAHAILVDKLCALLGRAEPRDLVDVRALLEAGHDLVRALSDAPSRDSGFSALTLAWVLRSLPAGPLAAWQEDLPAFRDRLVDDLVTLGGPP